LRDAETKLNPLGALPLALTALFVVLGFFPALCPSRGLLFLFFFVYLVLVPGALIARRVAPEVRGTAFVLASFALGMAAVFIALFAFALLRLDVTLLRMVLPPVVVLLSVARRRP
jgi:hypothetical protein